MAIIPGPEISTAGLISSVVPRLYFKRIILESGARHTKHFDKEDPHIDPRWTEAIYFFGFGAPILLKPAEWAHGWEIEGKSLLHTEQLIVTVDVVLKQVIHPQDLAGGWFREEGYKYLNFGVLQVVDGNDIQIFSEGIGGTASEYDPGLVQDKLAQLILNRSEANISGIGLTTTATAATALKDLANNQMVSLSSLQSNPGYIKPRVSHVQSDGSVVYDIPYQFEFVVENTAYPSQLAYFGAVGFDKALFEDSELAEISGGSRGHEHISLGEPQSGEYDFDVREFTELSSELVIKEGSTLMHGTMFRIAEDGFEDSFGKRGDIWAGPVHYNPSKGWIAGEKPALNPTTLKLYGMSFTIPVGLQPILNAETVLNTTIQDFRARKEIEKITLDLASLDPSADPKNLATRKFLIPDKTPLEQLVQEKGYSYFSDAFMSKGNPKSDQHEVQFLFAVDYLNLLKDNIKLPGLIERAEKTTLPKYVKKFLNATEITQKSVIQSIEILRRRVKLGLDGIPVKFNKNTITEVIARSEDWTDEGHVTSIFPTLKQAVEPMVAGQHGNQAWWTGVTTLKEIAQIVNESGIETDGIFNIDQMGPDAGIRYFSVVDSAFGFTKEGGIYQYGVRMTIKDASLDYIKNRILLMMQLYIKIFENYYSKCIKKTSFDILTNGFTSKFKSEISKLDRTTIKNGCRDFNNLLKLMFGKQYNESFVNNMILFSLPESGNPSGVKTVLELMKDFYTKISTFVGVKPNRNVQQKDYPDEPAPGTGTSSSTPKHFFTIEHFFDETVDAEEDAGVGWEYMPAMSGLSNGALYGLPHYRATPGAAAAAFGGTWDNYLGRIKRETLKYFTSTGVKIPDFSTDGHDLEISKYSYLTPMTVNLPGKEISQHKFGNTAFSNNLNLKEDQEILASILKYTSGRHTVGGTYVSNSDLDNYYGALSADEKHDTRRYKLAQLLEEKSCIFKREEFEEGVSPLTFNEEVAWMLTGIGPLFVPYLIDIMELTNPSSPLKLSQYNFPDKTSMIASVIYTLSPKKALFPNQLKALITNSIDNTKVKYDWYVKKDITGNGTFYATGLKWNNLATFILNFMTIAQVDVFTGFKKDNNKNSYFFNRPNMKSPQWIAMGPALFNYGAQTEAKPALCRLSPYQVKISKPPETPTGIGITPSPVMPETFEYKSNKFLQLPIYNRHFIIQF